VEDDEANDVTNVTFAEPISLPDYTTSNVTTNRTLDADNYTTDDIADVV